MTIEKIKFNRGLKANLPTLDIGEPAYVIDEEELYVGDDGGNIKVTNNKEIAKARGNFADLDARLDNVDSQLADIDQQKAENESAVLGAELLNGIGWASTGWTGDFTTGFTHTAGNTNTLSRTIGATGAKLYQIEFDTSDPLVADELYVSVGNSATFDLYAGAITHYSLGIQSVSDGDLVFTPISSFNKTISNISVKEITGAFDGSFKKQDSTGANALEMRLTKASKLNTFIGINSGRYNTTGDSNVGIGDDNLATNTSGFWNASVGVNSMRENTTGSRNSALGYNALLKNKSGQRNQAIGSFSLVNNVSGIKNACLGSDTMLSNTTGSFNVAIGFSALYNNTNGIKNVAIGNSAMSLNIAGESNVAVGASALQKNTASNSVAIGTSALLNSTGVGNVGIGFQAGDNITTGTQNIIIGYNVDAPSATDSYQLNVGNAIYGNLNTGNIGIGDNSKGVGSDGSYSGLKLEIGKTDKKGVLNLSFSATADGTDVGIVGFMNASNLDTSGVNRKTIAYIASSVYTTDNNADGDSGGILKFFVKPENSALSERMRLDAFGRLGIGVTSPTATLHLKAGSTGSNTAPLKLTAGSLNTNPEAGAIEFDGTNLYFVTSGGVRKTITAV